MSTRTIIEFNHDYIEELRDAGHISHPLFRWIMAHYTRSNEPLVWPGIRYLGTRHHSETLELKVE